MIAWLGIALALYEPFRSRPYDVQDFPELLAIIRPTASPLDAFFALCDYLFSHGRLNLVIAGQFVLKWELMGESMALWHSVRAVEMCLLAVLLVALLRRMGCSSGGAYTASFIVLASPAAVLSWSRMTVGEPTGAIVLLVLCLLLLHEGGQRPSRARLLALSLIVIVLGLVKETLLVAVPVVTIGIIGMQAHGRTSISLLAKDPRVHAVVVGGIIVSLPVLYIAAQAPTESYSNYFGVGSMSAASFFMPLLSTLVPIAPSSTPLSVIESVALIAYIGGMIGTWAILIADHRLSTRWLLLFGLGLPIAGALIYAPWPRYRLYYALPFQIGTALLAGIAISRVRNSARPLRVSAFAGLACIGASMAAFADSYLSFLDATRKMTHNTASWLGGLPPSNPVAVEICRMPRQHFSDYDYFLRSYSQSMGLAPPPVREAPCAYELPMKGNRQPEWRVMLSRTPPASPPGGINVVYGYSAFDLRNFKYSRDSMVVTTWPPS